MKKDVIYIDTEDDITAVVSKIKSSSQKIIALVPPKRIGILRSTVNMRLLARTAEQIKKSVVIVTNDKSITQLAAAAKIPVAKNLQSKPEVASIPVLDVDDGDDVIDGSKLAIGEHQDGQKKSIDEPAVSLSGIDIDDDVDADRKVRSTKKAVKSKKVPNFGRFRKWFALIAAGILLIVGFLVWALVYAPAATITLTAKTMPVSIDDVVTFGKNTDVEQGVIKPTKREVNKDISLEFEATGEKNVGDKATGTVKFKNPNTNEITIPSGTALESSNDNKFLVTSSVTVPAATCHGSIFNCQQGEASGNVEADQPGGAYNGDSGSLSGAPNGASASFADSTSGGTTEMVPIVTASDVQKAKQKLVDQSTDNVEKELATKFGADAKLIGDSFNSDYGDVKSEPEVGDQAKNGKANLKTEAVYSMYAISEKALTDYLKQTISQQMKDQTKQEVYDSGMDSIKLSDYSQSGDVQSVHLAATGQLGPKVDEQEIKELVAGKRYGAIRTELMKIDGVNDVDVDFSYFWVRKVPKDLSKITIAFNVETRGSS